MGRAPCCSKVGLHKGAWSNEEDKLLTSYIQTHGEGQWRSMPSKAGLLRCGKSCRLRWVNYLRPDIKRGSFTADEDDIIIRLHYKHGSRWSFIATQLPGRTDNEIKNHWNAHLKPKKLQVPKKIKKNKRKINKTKKSMKINIVENPEQSVCQPTSSSSTLTSSQSKSGPTIDHREGDADLLAADFSWPNLSPLFEMEGYTSCVDGYDELLDMSFDGFDSMMSMTHDESDIFQKLYDECLHLIRT